MSRQRWVPGMPLNRRERITAAERHAFLAVGSLQEPQGYDIVPWIGRECVTYRRDDGVFVAGPPVEIVFEHPVQACFAACRASLDGEWCPCQPRVSRSDQTATVETVETVEIEDELLELSMLYLRAVVALRLIGWSYHTFSPRLGPKAQVARWGLNEDEFPCDWLPAC